MGCFKDSLQKIPRMFVLYLSTTAKKFPLPSHFRVQLGNLVPVKNLPILFNIVSSEILVLKIISMLPNVQRKDRCSACALANRIVLIKRSCNVELSIFISGKEKELYHQLPKYSLNASFQSAIL